MNLFDKMKMQTLKIIIIDMLIHNNANISKYNIPHELYDQLNNRKIVLECGNTVTHIGRTEYLTTDYHSITYTHKRKIICMQMGIKYYVYLQFYRMRNNRIPLFFVPEQYDNT